MFTRIIPLEKQKQTETKFFPLSTFEKKFGFIVEILKLKNL